MAATQFVPQDELDKGSVQISQAQSLGLATEETDRRLEHCYPDPPTNAEEAYRDRILADISTERWRQKQQWGGTEHDRLHSPNDWIAIICKQAGKALDGREFYWQMIKVAAVAIAALEDGRDEPSREALT